MLFMRLQAIKHCESLAWHHGPARSAILRWPCGGEMWEALAEYLLTDTELEARKALKI